MVKMQRAYCVVQMPSYRRPTRTSGIVAQCVQGDGLAVVAGSTPCRGVAVQPL